MHLHVLKSEFLGFVPSIGDNFSDKPEPLKIVLIGFFY